MISLEQSHTRIVVLFLDTGIGKKYATPVYLLTSNSKLLCYAVKMLCACKKEHPNFY